MNLRNRRAEKFHEKNREVRSARPSGRPVIACGKACYVSRSEARSAVRRSIGNGSMADKELMTHYWCDKCEAWHIGHSRPPKGRNHDVA